MEINLKRQLTPFEWLQLPTVAQDLLKAHFNIPKTGGAVVIGNIRQSDGHTINDLSVVNLKALQGFLITDDSHWDNLLVNTINKLENGNFDNQGSTNHPALTSTDFPSYQPGSADAVEDGGGKKVKKTVKRSAVPVPGNDV